MNSHTEQNIAGLIANIYNGNIIKITSPSNVEISLDTGLKLFSFMQQMFRDIPFGVIIDKSNPYSLSPEMIVQGRPLTESTSLKIRAMAFLANTPAGIEASKMEINLLRDIVPTKICGNQSSAITWLNEQLK